MRFRPLVYSLASALLVAALGCGKGSTKLVGTWALTLPNGAAAEQTFNADGTTTEELSNPEVAGMKIDCIGKYRMEGDQLVLTFEDVQFKNLPDSMKSLEADSKEAAKKQLNVGKDVAAKITWQSDTAFTTTSDGGKSQTFTKKA
jgi:hypothetical protein